jgi:hypothetical protein
MKQKASMVLGNKAGFFRWAYVRHGFWFAFALLGGCGQATRKQASPPIPPTLQAVDIGIPACNAYLNDYLACHRAARIFAPDTLQGHYQAMLSSLQQGAADPQVRPYLAGRCVVLRQQLMASLQASSCAAPVTGPQTGTPLSAAPIRPQR